MSQKYSFQERKNVFKNIGLPYFLFATTKAPESFSWNGLQLLSLIWQADLNQYSHQALGLSLTTVLNLGLVKSELCCYEVS